MNYPSTTTKRVACPAWLQLSFALVGAIFAPSNLTAATPDAFAGRWDLTITTADKKHLPSWLELKKQDGTWKADFVGRWGNARPLPNVVIESEQIQFVSPKERSEDHTF